MILEAKPCSLPFVSVPPVLPQTLDAAVEPVYAAPVPAAVPSTSKEKAMKAYVLACSVLMVTVDSVRDPPDVLARLRNAGGYLNKDEGGEVVTICIGKKATDSDLSGLCELRKLKYLNLMGTKLTDEGLRSVAELGQLQSIRLTGTDGITDEGHRRLEAMQSLKAVVARQQEHHRSGCRTSPQSAAGLQDRLRSLTFTTPTVAPPRDIGTVANALKPFQHQCHFLAVLPDLFDWRLRERNRPTQRLRQDLRRLPHRSYVAGEIDLAAVQGSGVGERARTEPANVVDRNHLQLRALPERPSERGTLETERRYKVLHEEHRTQDHVGVEAEARTVSSMRHLLSKCGTPVCLSADPTDV